MSLKAVRILWLHVVVHGVYTTDIDNTQEPSSHADGTSANQENFAV